MKSILRVVVLTALCFSALSAIGQKVDLSQPLTDVKGTALTENGPDGKPKSIQLWEICINALEAVSPGTQQLSGIKKFEQDELARRIYKNREKSTAFTTDELKTIKEAIGNSFPPVIVGATWRLLDPSLNN